MKADVVHPEMYDYICIPIPKRPAWDVTTTRDELEKAENLAFLDWRRDLALMAEKSSFTVTPYEKNLEVWRQLWRVCSQIRFYTVLVNISLRC